MPPEISLCNEEPKLAHFNVFDVSFNATPGQRGQDNGTVLDQQTNGQHNKSKNKLGAMLGLGAGVQLNNTAFRAKSITELLKTNSAIFFLRWRIVRDIVSAALGLYPFSVAPG